MWFVILALLIVAAYFVYDALRDRRLANSGSSMSTTQRHPSSADNSATANYQKVNTTVATKTEQTGSIAANDTGTRAAAGTAATAAGAAIAAGVAASAVATTAKKRSSSGKLQFLEAPIGAKDDLTRIDGIGPIIESELNGLGIYHYHQIGNFSDSDVESVNAELDFPGRIERESWIAQARNLMTDSSAIGISHKPAGSAAAPGSAAGLAVAAGAAGSAAVASSGAAANADEADDDDFVLTEGDLTGAWNTDVLIEVQERLKVLNTRESDAPRLNISREDYRALKNDDDERFSRDDLLKILDRLRVLET